MQTQWVLKKTLNLRELYSIIHVGWILGPGQEDLQKNIRVGY